MRLAPVFSLRVSPSPIIFPVMASICTRFTLVVSGAILLCSCTTRSEGARPAQASDSEEVTELNSAADSSSAAARKAPASPSAARTAASSSQPDTIDAAAPKGGVESAPASGRSNFRCGVRNNPILTSLGIGNLQIGRTIAVVKQTCRVLRDLPEQDEGVPERIVTVMVVDEPIRVTVANGLVWRLALRSPRFATRDGLRVGTSLARLVERGGVHLSEGQDGLYVMLDAYCGLSFRFSIPSRETPGKPWTVAHVVARHGSAVVDRILVTRCAG